MCMLRGVGKVKNDGILGTRSQVLIGNARMRELVIDDGIPRQAGHNDVSVQEVVP